MASKKEIDKIKKMIADPRTNAEDKKRFEKVLEKIEKATSIKVNQPKDGGDIKKNIGKKFRPFTSNKPEYFVEITDITEKGVSYKHLDNGEAKTSPTKEFFESYITLSDDEEKKLKPKQANGKIPIKHIEIFWAEGDTSRYDKFPKKYTSWSSAHAAVMPVYWDYVSSKSGGYNKVKFEVIWEDGEDYGGRLDVSDNEDNPSQTSNVFGNHIKDYFDHQLSEKSSSSEATKQEIRGYMKKYDLGLDGNDLKKPSYSPSDKDCEEIIADAEKKAKKARASAKKSANKTPLAKQKGKIDSVEDSIMDRVKAGTATKAEILSLIKKAKELIETLEKALSKL